MRKITIVITIAFLCSFAVVRRRENVDSEVFFQEAITQVIESTQKVYQIQEQEATVGNGDYLLWDSPVPARQLLSGVFHDILIVTLGKQLSWIELANGHGNGFQQVRPVFWDLN